MGKLEDTEEERMNWHWRNSMRPARFFNLDARAVFPFLILLVHMRTYTLVLTILFTLIFIYLERRGLTFDASLRAFRLWIVGNKRPAWLSRSHRRMVDYG